MKCIELICSFVLSKSGPRQCILTKRAITNVLGIFLLQDKLSQNGMPTQRFQARLQDQALKHQTPKDKSYGPIVHCIQDNTYNKHCNRRQSWYNKMQCNETVFPSISTLLCQVTLRAEALLCFRAPMLCHLLEHCDVYASWSPASQNTPVQLPCVLLPLERFVPQPLHLTENKLENMHFSPETSAK